MSKFDRLFRVANAEEALEPDLAKPNKTSVAPLARLVQNKPVAPKTKGKAVLTAARAATQPDETAERAKVSGKRQHPDFVGLTTYVRKDTHRRVKIALLVEGDNRELSELVDELLEAWLTQKDRA